MTSTNDGKDVKSNQNSGPKGKTYYIELYKSLDAALNAEGELSSRTDAVCAAWRRVHALCQHSAPPTHSHLLTWLQRHTARTILQSEWQSPQSKDEHTKLEEAIDFYIQECNRDTSKDGGLLPWETQLLARAEWFKGMLANPWGHPVLKVLLDPKEKRPSSEEILEWLKEERGVVFLSRLRQLALSKCDDLALELLTVVMDRVRQDRPAVNDLTDYVHNRVPEPPELTEPTFESVLSEEAGFADVWDTLTDMEFVILHKRDRNARLIDLAKQTLLHSGYQLVERLLSRLETAPREKKIWKNAKDVAILITQVLVARCMVVPVCWAAVRAVLYFCARSLAHALPDARLARAAALLAAPAASARHLHILASAVHAEQSTKSEELNPCVVVLYVRAITFGMNELEKLKLEPEKEKEARTYEQTLAQWFIQLGQLLSKRDRVRYECVLTAFSVHPSQAMYDRIKAAPHLDPVAMDTEPNKEDSQTASEYGSWANDSRSQTNLVKTSETLNLKQSQQPTQANVLSTAILTEGELLGLDAELCQDISVLLAGPRVKTLSWDMDRELLLENCRAYMERTHGGTRALTTELKFLNLDLQQYQHLPEEEDDDNDLYYGIEKGYEHLVELQEPQPELIWEDAFHDPEQTESASSSFEEYSQTTRRKKKTKQPTYKQDTDSETDPLSLVAENKRVAEKKKERPHSKERSKEGKKKQKEPKDTEKRKEGKEDKSKKKEKKERKKKEKQDKKFGITIQNASMFNDMFITDSDYDSQGKSSQYSDGHDPAVLYDGQFSMDELKSPDVTKHQSPSKEFSIMQGKVKVQKVQAPPKPKVSMPSKKPEAMTVVHKSPNIISHCNSILNKSVQEVREDVKKSISKLIHFRRQKANEASQSQADTMKPKDQSEASSVALTKQQAQYIVHFSKQQTEQMAAGREETNNFLSSPKPAIFYPEKNNDGCMRTVAYDPNRKVSPVNTSSRDLKFNQALYPVPPPLVPTSPSTHLSSYQQFLKDLQRPNTTMEDVRPRAKPAQKKERKPVHRVTPVVPNVVPTIKPETSPQCAKPVQQKKTENAPNTFSRLSYMHKNKQVDKPKETFESANHALQTSVSEELDKRIADLKYYQAKMADFQKEYGVPQNSVTEKQPERPKNAARTENHLPNSNPVLTSMLREAAVSVKKKVYQTNAVIQSALFEKLGTNTAKPNDSILTDKDQQDILRILGQKNALNPQASKKAYVSNNVILNKPDTSSYNSAHKYLGMKVSYANKNTVPTASVPDQQKIVDRIQKAPVPSNPKCPIISNSSIMKTVELIQSRSIAHSIAKEKQPHSFSKTVTANAMSNQKTPDVKDTTKKYATKPPAATPKLEENWQEQDWTRVLDALRAHKTPSRGPNALEMVLKNQTFENHEEKNQRITSSVAHEKVSITKNNVMQLAVPKDSNNVIQQSVPKIEAMKHTTPKATNIINQSVSKIKTNVLQHTITKATNEVMKHAAPKATNNLMQNVVPKTATGNNIQHTIPKTNALQHAASSKPHAVPVTKVINNLKKAENIPRSASQKKPANPNRLVSYPEVVSNSNYQPQVQKEDPFISGIPNSDYEILDELIDDDLRKEIGELSSDEESYRSSSTSLKSHKISSTVKSGSNVSKAQNKPKQIIVDTGLASHAGSKTQMNAASTSPTQSKAKPVILSNEKVDLNTLQNMIAASAIRMSNKTRKVVETTHNVDDSCEATSVTPNDSTHSSPYIDAARNICLRNKTRKVADTTYNVGNSREATNVEPCSLNQNMPYIDGGIIRMGYKSRKVSGTTYNVANNCETTNVTPQSLNPTRPLNYTGPYYDAASDIRLNNKTCNVAETTYDVPDDNEATNVIPNVSSHTGPYFDAARDIRLSHNTCNNAETTYNVANNNEATNVIPAALNQSGPYFEPSAQNALLYEPYQMNYMSVNSPNIAIYQPPPVVISNNYAISGVETPVAVNVQPNPIQAYAAPLNMLPIVQTPATVMFAPVLQQNVDLQGNPIVNSEPNESVTNVFKNDSEPKPQLDRNIEQPTANVDCDASKHKTSERRVLSEVQEKLIEPVATPVAQRVSYESKIEKEIQDRRARKRLAIVNREINIRSILSPIALSYYPLTVSKPIEKTDTDVKSVVNAEKDNVNKVSTLKQNSVDAKADPTEVKPTEVVPTTEKIEDGNRNENSKENKSTLFHSIALRSTKSAPIISVPANNDKSVGRKTKVRLKATPKTKNVQQKASIKTDKSSLVSGVNDCAITTRVSKRILNKKIKDTTDVDAKASAEKTDIAANQSNATSNEDNISRTDIDKPVIPKEIETNNSLDSKEEKITNEKTNSLVEQNPQKTQNALQSLVSDIESAINVITENTVSSPLAKVPLIDNELLDSISETVLPTDATSITQQDVLPETDGRINSKTVQEQGASKELQESKTVTEVDKAYENPELSIDKSPDMNNVATLVNHLLPRQKQATSEGEPQAVNSEVSQEDKQCEKQDLNTVPRNDKELASKIASNAALKPQEYKNMVVQKEKLCESQDLLAVQSRRALRDSEIVEIVQKRMNAKKELKTKTHQESTNKTTYLDLPKTDANHIRKPNTLLVSMKENETISNKSSPLESNTKHNSMLESFKNKIQFEEIPGGSNPLVKCVRIRLPNNNVFKATVRSQQTISIDTLLDDPALQHILMNSMDAKHHFTVTIPHKSSAEMRVIDTVNLISDDEEEVAQSNKEGLVQTDKDEVLLNDKEVVQNDQEVDFQNDKEVQKLVTSSGAYSITGIDQAVFVQHQKRLSQICSIQLSRCDEKPKVKVLVDALIADLVGQLPLTESQTLITPVTLDNAPEIIEIDDSSDSDVPPFETETMSVLKDSLLQDLGINLQDTYHSQPKETTNKQLLELQKPNCQNKTNKNPIKSKEAIPKPVPANNSETVKQSNVITKECCIKLVRCDNLVKNMKNINQDHEYLTISDDENPDTVISRSDSLKILNDLAVIDEPFETSEGNSSPIINVSDTISALSFIENINSGVNSPVMEVYDMIAAFPVSDQATIEPKVPKIEHYHVECESEWFMTKGNERSLRFDCIEVNSCNDDSPTDCETDFNDSSILHEVKRDEFHQVPSLISTMSKYFEDNSIIYQLSPSTTTLIDVLERNVSLTIKRKLSVDDSYLCNKMTKMIDNSDEAPKTRHSVLKENNGKNENKCDTVIGNYAEFTKTEQIIACSPVSLNKCYIMDPEELTTKVDIDENCNSPSILTDIVIAEEKDHIIVSGVPIPEVCDVSPDVEYSNSYNLVRESENIEPETLNLDTSKIYVVENIKPRLDLEEVINQISSNVEIASENLHKNELTITDSSDLTLYTSNTVTDNINTDETSAEKNVTVLTSPEIYEVEEQPMPIVETCPDNVEISNQEESDVTASDLSNILDERDHEEHNVSVSSITSVEKTTDCCENEETPLVQAVTRSVEPMTITETTKIETVTDIQQPVTCEVETKLNTPYCPIEIATKEVCEENQSPGGSNEISNQNVVLMDTAELVEEICIKEPKKAIDKSHQDSLLEVAIGKVCKKNETCETRNISMDTEKFAEDEISRKKPEQSFGKTDQITEADDNRNSESNADFKHENEDPSKSEKRNQETETQQQSTENSVLEDQSQTKEEIEVCNIDSVTENDKLVQTDMHDNNNEESVCASTKNTEISSNQDRKDIFVEQVVLDDDDYLYETEVLAEDVETPSSVIDRTSSIETICDPIELSDDDKNKMPPNQVNGPFKDIYKGIEVEKSIREIDYDAQILENNATLIYKEDSGVVLKGIEYEDPEIGTCYVFPIIKSDNESGSSQIVNDNSKSLIEAIKEDEVSASGEQGEDSKSADHNESFELKLLEPKITYLRHNLKRKGNMKDVEVVVKKLRRNSKGREQLSDTKISQKKYRKGKNIDYPKLTPSSIAKMTYAKEYKRHFDYYKTVGFSYALSYSEEFIEVPSLLQDWPIKGSATNEIVSETSNGVNLFTDVETHKSPSCDPLSLTLAEEIKVEEDDDVTNYTNDCEINEKNFNMGFGEGSGRVIQNLKAGAISKFSAATLSDVKQFQPCLLFNGHDPEGKRNFSSPIVNQRDKIKQFVTSIHLKEKVRSFFRQTAIELSQEQKHEDFKDDGDISSFPFELYIPKYIAPRPIEAVVQVVQVGQLPVSAAAQNPVTCDPRVTQVSDASPSQCSAENSPNDDSQPGIKTEYTELTTADLSLPLGDNYAPNTQTMQMQSQDTINVTFNSENIPIETEMMKSEIKIELEDEDKENPIDNDKESELNNHMNDVQYMYDNNHTGAVDSDFQALFNSEKHAAETNQQQNSQNGSSEKTDQIAHAMNAAGITLSEQVSDPNTRAHALVNILSQKIRQGVVSSQNSNTPNHFSKTATINAMSLQQALAQILPPPLNQTNSTDNNQQGQNSVTPQVLHIVQGKNASGNQITLVDNTQQSVINTPNATSVLHIVQNKTVTPGPTSNGSPAPQSTYSGLSLVDAGLQQGGNQLLHIVNTGNQKNTNAGQLLKRVNLLTNLANVQGSNEQKMVQFVCKSADGKSIQLNAPHQRSMVLRLQPIETPNVQPPPQPSKPPENQDLSPTPTTANSAPNKDNNGQQEIKSRSVYEENYAKFIQSSAKPPPEVKPQPLIPAGLPKFNQVFGKQVFHDKNQKQNDINNSNNSNLTPVSNNVDNTECPPSDNPINLEHMRQIGSPPLLLRKPATASSQAPPNLVQQIKQTIAPMNIQTMHGGVIYTRQIPVNIGGGQTINLITVPSTELMDENGQKQGNQSDMEPSIIKIVPQGQAPPNSEASSDNMNANGDSAQNPQQQPVLTQMRIKLPMLSKAPQMVSGARVVRPSFFQIQRNVIGGANQPVYQQLVLTAAPPLGQQTIRLPQAQAKPKVPENQSESQMSSSTLEQLREFDMVLEQVKERSTVQPNSSTASSSFKLHTTSSDTTDSSTCASSMPTETTQVLYSIGSNQSLNVAYVNRKPSVSTPTTSTFVRSPDSSGIADSPSSSTHVSLHHTVTTESSSSETTTQPKPVKCRPTRTRHKSTSNPPMKSNPVPPKPTTQKPLEDEQTTQRILYILAEYKEQVENSPDKDKPAPRRRSNPPSNPGSSKRKKSSSGSRKSGGRDSSPLDDSGRTMGSEDSSCGTSQGDCAESCLEPQSPQDSPRKVARKLNFDQETPAPQPSPKSQPQRNVIVADGQTITVARGTAGKPATAVLMPANYILPVSMVKGGQQIAIVTNRGPKLLTVGGGEGGATNALLLQRLIGPAGLKPMLARPGVRHVRLPTSALHNLQAFNLATATSIQPPDSTASSASEQNPPDLIDTRAAASPWNRESESKPDGASSPDEAVPWHVPSSADPHDYLYEETVRTDNMNRTVLDPIQDRYSPDMEAQRIFDKMFDVDTKKSYDSPRCAYDIDASDCDDKPYQVVQKKDSTSRHTRLSHVSAAALRHKYAILEHELRLQKSLSEECEDLGVDSPSAAELFPEAELLFAGSPAQDHGPETPHHSHTPQPTILNQSVIQPDIDDQIATDQLIPRTIIPEDRQQLAVNLGLEDVGIVTVSEDGMQATIALDQEEFARSHPNTTFHSEPTEEGEVQPFTIAGLKTRHITSTIFHSNRAPATVLMTAPQTTVISQATAHNTAHNVKYSDIDNMINSLPSTHTNNINLSSVLVKDDGLTRFDSILTDSRELHLSHTASAIIHPSGHATQVIRRVGYDESKRERERFLIDEPDAIIAGDDAKMVAEDSSRDATLHSMGVDDGTSSPERHAELFWESNSASERSEGRRPLDFSSDSEKCCKSPSYDETNSTDSSGLGNQMRLDSVIKKARLDRSGSADGSSADDHPPLRTYPPKRPYHPLEGEVERSLSGKTRAGERSPDLGSEVRRRASVRGVVKRGCHCCNGSPAPSRPKKPRQRKPTLDFNN